MSKVAEACDWEGWFQNWTNAHCQPNSPPPSPPSPSPPSGCMCGVDCCYGLDLPSAGLNTHQRSLADCGRYCGGIAGCHAYVFQRHFGRCYCKSEWAAAGPEPNATWPEADACACNRTTLMADTDTITLNEHKDIITLEKHTNTTTTTLGEKQQRQADILLQQHPPTNTTEPDSPRGVGGWPSSCIWPASGITHGVNIAEALKSAAVLWRIHGRPELRALSAQRRQNLDEKYGVATGLFCADESLCAPPGASEEERKSPSRGTELCAVVESMFSYNEMFSILGNVADADRAERIALNALPATWASPRPSEVHVID